MGALGPLAHRRNFEPATTLLGVVGSTKFGDYDVTALGAWVPGHSVTCFGVAVSGP